MDAVVTGGAGFVGSHLVDHLLAFGHRVTVLDDLSSGRLENLEAAASRPGFRLVTGSILDPEAVETALADADTVFHLAAAVGVRTIVEDPIRSLRVNLHGTETVLAAAARRGCRLLLASTSEVYGKSPARVLSEDGDRVLGDALKGRWSYAAGKGLDELMVFHHYLEHRLPTVIVRLFNVVGPRQVGHYGMVVPRFVGQAIAGQPITVYGDGRQRRCFCAVEDVVPCMVDLLDRPAAYGRAVNLGNDEEVTVAELALRVRGITGSSSPIEFVPYSEAYGPGFEDMAGRVPDLSRALAIIGYRPSMDLDEILRRIVARWATPASGRPLSG